MNRRLTVTGTLGAAVAAGAAVAVVRGSVTDETHEAPGLVQDFSCDTLTMQIEFERTGGIAGMTVTASVDTDTLPDDERQEVCQLIEDANFFELPATVTDSTPRPDGFNYEITIGDGRRSHTVVTSDGAAPDTLVPLLDWLNRAARRRRGP